MRFRAIKDQICLSSIGFILVYFFYGVVGKNENHRADVRVLFALYYRICLNQLLSQNEFSGWIWR